MSFYIFENVIRDHRFPRLDFITFFLPKFYFSVAFPLQIIEKGLMTRADYEEASEKALRLFEYGQVISLFD
jgi:hypothetical protein